MDHFEDPVVEEVRARGRVLTERYDNDPRRIMDLLRQYTDEHADQAVDQIRIVKSKTQAS